MTAGQKRAFVVFVTSGGPVGHAYDVVFPFARKEEAMTDPIHIKASSTRAGLTPNAIFRLWSAAVKDDERLLDEAIAAVHDQMISSDRVRAEHVATSLSLATRS